MSLAGGEPLWELLLEGGCEFNDWLLYAHRLLNVLGPARAKFTRSILNSGPDGFDIFLELEESWMEEWVVGGNDFHGILSVVGDAIRCILGKRDTCAYGTREWLLLEEVPTPNPHIAELFDDRMPMALWLFKVAHSHSFAFNEWDEQYISDPVVVDGVCPQRHIPGAESFRVDDMDMPLPVRWKGWREVEQWMDSSPLDCVEKPDCVEGSDRRELMSSRLENIIVVGRVLLTILSCLPDVEHRCFVVATSRLACVHEDWSDRFESKLTTPCVLLDGASMWRHVAHVPHTRHTTPPTHLTWTRVGDVLTSSLLTSNHVPMRDHHHGMITLCSSSGSRVRMTPDMARIHHSPMKWDGMEEMAVLSHTNTHLVGHTGRHLVVKDLRSNQTHIIDEVDDQHLVTIMRTPEETILVWDRWHDQWYRVTDKVIHLSPRDTPFGLTKEACGLLRVDERFHPDALTLEMTGHYGVLLPNSDTTWKLHIDNGIIKEICVEGRKPSYVCMCVHDGDVWAYTEEGIYRGWLR